MWYLILTIITIIYLYLNFITSGSLIEAYILRPILWITLAIITLFIAYKEGKNILKFKKIRKWNLGKTPIHTGLLLGGFQVALLIIIGILFGFGKSPYSHSTFGITINAIFIGAFLAGTEISRAYLIKKGTTQRKYTTLILILITLLYMAIRISANDFAVLNFTEPVATLEFIGSTIIVLLAMNLLASYLSYLGGATAAIAYMAPLMALEYFSPILPNPHWTIIALIGTIAPAIGFIVLQDTIQPFINKKLTHRKRKKASGSGWTIMAIFTLIIIFFSFGYLGVEPSVIYSGSMQPEYHVGDIVIVDEIATSSIREGDVIQFVRNNQTVILHRVVEIIEDEDGQILFIVKGDANDEPDSAPVHPNQILGKAIFTIPEIGWIQIYVKEFFKNLLAPI